MKIAYIAGPYRGETVNQIRTNIQFAENYATFYWQKGYMAYCPHKNSAYFDGLVSDKQFLDGGLEFIKRMKPGYDIMVMIPGWEKSSGSKAELKLATKLGIEIIYE